MDLSLTLNMVFLAYIRLYTADKSKGHFPFLVKYEVKLEIMPQKSAPVLLC